MRNPTLGSISHGTLRTQDLLRAFARELEAITNRPQIDPSFNSDLVHDARVWAHRLDADPTRDDEQTASEILWEIDRLLNKYAPAGHYFGAHEGDGSDFGFWPLGFANNEDDQ